LQLATAWQHQEAVDKPLEQPLHWPSALLVLAAGVVAG
jgi:hypothetical protein